MARSGVHPGREYKGINTVRNIIRWGEWCTGEGKSNNITSWDCSEVTNLLRENSWEGRNRGDGGVFGRQLQWGGEYSVGNKPGEGSTAWGIKARKSVQWGDEEYSRQEYNSPG